MTSIRRPIVLALVVLAAGCSVGPPARRFPTPQEAVAALVEALRSRSIDRLNDVLGPAAGELVFSGDAVADEEDMKAFVAAYDRKRALSKDAEGNLTLVIGEKDWPFPVPLVADGDAWRFDGDMGREEILSRRIGRNELNAIEVCLALADAQREYARLRIGGTAQYARKILSEPGQRNGLYWKTGANEAPSPLGPLVAQAAEEGYTAAAADPQRGAYHGYRYRVLTKQGPAAKGGERDYVLDGRMIGGFAFVAFPAEYGSSGVMTFIVNHEGIVHEADLGDNTAKVASRMTSFDPGEGWRPASAAEEKPR